MLVRHALDAFLSRSVGVLAAALAALTVLTTTPVTAETAAVLDPGLAHMLRQAGLDPAPFQQARQELERESNIADKARSCLELGKVFDRILDDDALKRSFVLAAHWEAGKHPEQVKVTEAIKGAVNSAGEINAFLAEQPAADYPDICVSGYRGALILLGRGDLRGTEREAGRARGAFGHLAERGLSGDGGSVPNPPTAATTRRDDARAGGPRVALLIANERYAVQSSIPPLRTPAADVSLISGALRQAGFTEVDVVRNASRAEMVDALRRFQEKADGADTALIYYAGHGLQSQGENYAVPADARLADERSIADETVSQDRLMSAMARVGKLKILITDACRDNPFVAAMRTEGGSRGLTRGLAHGSAPPDITPSSSTPLRAGSRRRTAVAPTAPSPPPSASAFCNRAST